MEGKRSLILAHLFERVSGQEADALRDFLGRPRYAPAAAGGRLDLRRCCADTAVSSTRSKRRASWQRPQSASSRPLSPERGTMKRSGSSVEFWTTWSSAKPENRSGPKC